jgi:hypothetical protein
MGVTTSAQRRAAGFELVVVLTAQQTLRALIHWNAAKPFLPAMPIVERSWILFVFSVIILSWMRRRHPTELANFGLKPFFPWKRLTLLALLAVIACVVIGSFTAPITAALFGKPALHRFGQLEHNLSLYLGLLPVVFLFAGFGEEFLERGFIMTRLALFFGRGAVGWSAALIIQAIIFGLGHSYLGVSGMIDAGIYGLIFGVIFIVAGCNLWPNAIAHAVLDSLAFTLIYLGLMKV